MSLLDGVSTDQLHDALAEVEGKKPTQRLLFAILYKQGPSVPMIAEWFDMRAQTIYRWFEAMETEPLHEAIHDDPPPGRPPKLSESAYEQFLQTLEAPPSNVGYAADAWTTELVSQHLLEEFGVEYSRRHVRRLIADAGNVFE